MFSYFREKKLFVSPWIYIKKYCNFISYNKITFLLIVNFDSHFHLLFDGSSFNQVDEDPLMKMMKTESMKNRRLSGMMNG